VWATSAKNQRLPYPGGFDQEGNLTDVAASIEKTRRILPMGYWKGSGFAVMLDLFSAMLTGGLTTAEIDKAGKGSCGSCSQVFIAFDPIKFNAEGFLDQAIQGTIDQLKASIPVQEGGEIFYPGEQSLRKRNENNELGIPVDDSVWAKVKELAKRK
jgi:3-dehydro-L-gulonate 2-dehydrogenase